MKKAPILITENERQAALDAYQITDTAPEIAFDDITALASWIAGTPIALVSLVDRDRQWFKSKVGLNASETPRDVSFCGHAIHGDDIFEIPNALNDSRFADNPLVTGGPNVIFYAGVPLTTPQGHNVGTLCVVDSKEGHLTEEQREMLRKLGRQVVAQMELRKRSMDLETTARQAIDLNKHLTEANAAKSRFLSNVSHEIRTPLNAISGALQLLADKQLPRDDLEMIAMANTASETVTQLINDVLDMAKIDSGRMQINLEPSNVADLTRSVRSMFMAKADLANVTLDLRITGEQDVTLMCDELRVKQILMNMIGNAIKFTPASGVVAIHLQLVRRERDYAATWDIKDSGIGMSAETIQKLGQAFEQADAGIQKKYGGTGLGLAMVKKLTDLLRGSLSIASELGKGSTFSVTIPMRPAAPQELSKHEMTDDTPIEVCGALIVDDTQTNRIVLNRMLSKLGFAPDEAENGPDALRIFRDKRPRVVFLDLQMPGMDGFEVIKNIRDIEATSPDQPKTFVIAVSGQAFDDDVEKCSKTGFDAHLPKPVSTRSLSAILRKRQASSTPAPERFRKN